jgi:hypothetical protein
VVPGADGDHPAPAPAGGSAAFDRADAPATTTFLDGWKSASDMRGRCRQSSPRRTSRRSRRPRLAQRALRLFGQHPDGPYAVWASALISATMAGWRRSFCRQRAR